MADMNGLRHYAKYQQEEVIILGYNKSRNDVLLVRVGALPGDEQMALRLIASSPDAQRNDYLVPVLQAEAHKSGADWFSYLVSQRRANRGAVLNIPIKDIQDLNQEQLAFFKGYGKSVLNKTVEQEMEIQAQPMARSVTPTTDIPDALYDVPDNVQSAPLPPAPPAGTDPALLALLSQVVEGQNKMQESLDKLATKVKTPRKTAGRRKPAPKKAEKTPADFGIGVGSATTE